MGRAYPSSVCKTEAQQSSMPCPIPELVSGKAKTWTHIFLAPKPHHQVPLQNSGGQSQVWAANSWDVPLGGLRGNASWNQRWSESVAVERINLEASVKCGNQMSGGPEARTCLWQPWPICLPSQVCLAKGAALPWKPVCKSGHPCSSQL